MKEIYIAYLENFKAENKSVNGNNIVSDLTSEQHREILKDLNDNRMIKGLTKNSWKNGEFHYVTSAVETTEKGLNYIKNNS